MMSDALRSDTEAYVKYYIYIYIANIIFQIREN